MKRVRDDSVKPGRGIDADLGENYTKQHRSDPWTPPKIGDGQVNSRGHGKYTDDESGLRNKAPGAGTGGTGESLQGGTRDILDDVEGNANAGTDKTGAIRYGID
jgi:hypothetical protein